MDGARPSQADGAGRSGAAARRAAGGSGGDPGAVGRSVVSGSWTARRGIRSRSNDDVRPYGAPILLVVLTAFAVGPLATVGDSAVSPDQIAALIAAACVLA